MQDTGSAASRAAAPSLVMLDGVTVGLHLVEAGLACCAVEQAAATALLDRLVEAQEESGGVDASAAADADALAVLVVSGTVTDAMAPLLITAFERLPHPRAVLSFGACAGTGGPYWDSPVVMNGIDQLLPVDLYVPGCPPRPEALVDGLRALVQSRVGAPPEVPLVGPR